MSETQHTPNNLIHVDVSGLYEQSPSMTEKEALLALCRTAPIIPDLDMDTDDLSEAIMRLVNFVWRTVEQRQGDDDATI